MRIENAILVKLDEGVLVIKDGKEGKLVSLKITKELQKELIEDYNEDDEVEIEIEVIQAKLIEIL